MATSHWTWAGSTTVHPLTGEPVAAGTFSFTVRCTDSYTPANSVTRTLSLQIIDPDPPDPDNGNGDDGGLPIWLFGVIALIAIVDFLDDFPCCHFLCHCLIAH